MHRCVFTNNNTSHKCKHNIPTTIPAQAVTTEIFPTVESCLANPQTESGCQLGVQGCGVSGCGVSTY